MVETSTTTEAVSRRMSRQARKDTAPELALRKELHRRGMRFRVEVAVPGMPRRRVDVVFSRCRLAVFVDGCFWHSCPVHVSVPVNNQGWWVTKLRANVERDRGTDAHLRAIGWRVLRIWEHESVADAADRVEHVVRSDPLPS